MDRITCISSHGGPAEIELSNLDDRFVFNGSSGWSFRISQKIMNVWDASLQWNHEPFFSDHPRFSLEIHIPKALHLKWWKDSPYRPCMVYLPTFGSFLWYNINVGKCTNFMHPMGYIVYSNEIRITGWWSVGWLFSHENPSPEKWSSGKRDELPALETSLFLKASSCLTPWSLTANAPEKWWLEGSILSYIGKKVTLQVPAMEHISGGLCSY